MKTESRDGVTYVVEQNKCIIPDFTVKDLLSAIPQRCFKRSALHSSLYIVWDVLLLTGIYKATTYVDPLLSPEHIDYPHPYLYPLARFALWALYSFGAGLVATGLWVVAHECGHQAFSESKFINNAVGWVLHSALGVPYHSWRISHAKHHASTGHMTQDQVFVPRTRSEMGLPPIDHENEDLLGASVSDKVMHELYDAIGDSPIGALYGAFSYLTFGWPMYLIRNASGQKRYPRGTSHYNPNAIIYAPHQFGQIVISDIGILLWIATLVLWTMNRGFAEVFRVYLVPYLWHVSSHSAHLPHSLTIIAF
ncbi:hypothetical protein EWM64_g10758 [Hericium alpestre]|uniref:Fatty acid desaturase domain-containing protein n=1 Tax=Hericium alpestre TaxID=135208 RepID=A0A4Y9ZFN7_9AGAM|nr:hypothetical protein EWM64_g10758 [Hericium alpestre]